MKLNRIFRRHARVGLLIYFILVLSVDGRAAGKLTFESDNTVIYSGPSTRFRPLGRGKRGASVSVSTNQVEGTDGEYYEVVFGSDDEKRIGYVLTTEKLKFERTADEQEDFKQYRSFALAESAVQLELNFLKDSSYLWSLGYLKYPAPGFYLKSFAGQILSRTSGSTMAGGELGFDQFIKGKYSVYTNIGGGPIFFPADNTLFVGSSSMGGIFYGGAGFRYTADQHAAFSLGFLQMSIFDSKNSFLSSGVGLTLEVGL